ncbi:helix-turn-helix domain-containing protein [Leucobacter soli]|uniref:Transcriptional activator FeaR n=1 Tax=Leucobacter soli TaxID=2812850 RepID=A0A916JYV8_9MICO|nr:helix-turn-helix domain-containing protein [Leucobacter soli]CAG7607731.1 Transcriptional activator FeaR [Leucobacter soli]
MQLAQFSARTRVSGAAPATVRADDLAGFRALVSSSFVPLDVTAERSDAFTARLCTAGADGIAFTEVAAKPHLVERTPATIESGGSGQYKVSLLLSGSSILVQDGKELVMRPGDLSIYDTSRPYSLLFTEEFRNLIVMFPKDRLELPGPDAQQLTAESLGAEHPGLGAVLTAFLSQFPEQLTDLGPRVQTKLAHTSLDLIGTLLSTILGADPAQQDPHQVLLRRIHEYIDDHLASPDLSPGGVAAAHYISKRHLHALFHETGMTVSTWVRERRLERCRQDLLDPRFEDRPVSAIAARWGLMDAAHFSRVFKETFGVSPTEFRRLAGESRDGRFLG